MSAFILLFFFSKFEGYENECLIESGKIGKARLILINVIWIRVTTAIVNFGTKLLTMMLA